MKIEQKMFTSYLASYCRILLCHSNPNCSFISQFPIEKNKNINKEHFLQTGYGGGFGGFGGE